MSTDIPVKKRKKTCENLLTLNQNYTGQLLKDFKTNYLQKKTFTDEETASRIYQEPFCHCVLPNFIQEVNELENLEAELSSLKFKEKNNDLYKFHQSSEDLKVIDTPYIRNLRKVIFKTFKNHLRDISGIDFTEAIDMSCARYDYTDILLCHDDELEGRRIAFIYYLVPSSWKQSDGGSLDLFTVDENGQPDKISKSLIPVRNNFVFFEVTPVSFHQVAEILSEDKTRLSISGWFHGPPIDRPQPYIEPKPSIQPAKDIEEEVFYKWINQTYLDTEVQASIKEKFESESEIELEDFLQPSKYKELKEAFCHPDITWNLKGPANKRHVLCCNHDNLPTVIQECLDFLQSDAMFLILSHLTGLKLHKLYEPSDNSDSEGESTAKQNHHSLDKIEPSCYSEVRHWKQGCYTLIHDTSIEGSQFALDSVLYIGSEDWKLEYGGFTSYIAKGDDEELLSIHPKENSLALVYRDKETLRFVKHINNGINKMADQGFYDISTVYNE